MILVLLKLNALKSCAAYGTKENNLMPSACRPTRMHGQAGPRLSLIGQLTRPIKIQQIADFWQFLATPFQQMMIHFKALKIFCFQFKGWNQPQHQPVLKFPHFNPASLQAKTAGISKLVDDKAGSILLNKKKISLPLDDTKSSAQPTDLTQLALCVFEKFSFGFAGPDDF